jgi:carbon monoxide dehydrogenase subunit G
MSMAIAKSFVVKAPAADAWAFLTDPRRVAACLPGAAVTGPLDDGTYTGTITMKVGPVSTSYKGTLRFERLDAAARTAELAASGQDIRGKGGARMRMTSRLVERGPAETEVSVVSQVEVMGLLAQLGRGMIADVSDQMFQRFVDAMRAQLETARTGPAPVVSEPMPAGVAAPAGAATPADASDGGRAATKPPEAAAPPIEVVSLGSAVLGRAVIRVARRPVVWAALVLIVLIVAARYWYLRRCC